MNEGVWMVCAVLAGATVLGAPKLASALGPLDVEIGAKAGFGTAPSHTPSGDANPLGFGIGARAGIAIVGLYGGVSFVYYIGGDEPAVTPMPGFSVTASTHSLMYGLEAGYGMKLVELLTLRAQVGIGNFTNTVDIGSSSTSSSNLYVEPGVTALVSLPVVGGFVGADANLLVLPGVNSGAGQSQTDTAFTVHGQVGYRF